jgi:hypothetical protein
LSIKFIIKCSLYLQIDATVLTVSTGYFPVYGEKETTCFQNIRFFAQMLNPTRTSIHTFTLTSQGLSTFLHSHSPLKVSAPNKIPSTPSRTAFATSVASALVGRGVLTIVSTTRVMMQGLPTRLQALEGEGRKGKVGERGEKEKVDRE